MPLFAGEKWVGLFLVFQMLALSPMEGASDSAASPLTVVPTITVARQQELFSALDLSAPELKSVNDAVAKGDYAAATHAWAEYLRRRTGIPWKFDYRHPTRQPDFKDVVADDAAGGKVVGGLVKIPYTWPHNDINWFYNATYTTTPVNPEWQWQLCRMDFWINLGAAYRATGDERYARAWVEQFRSFYEECPVPNENANYENSAWRPIEAGIRMQGSWPDAFFSFLGSPSITDENLAMYTLSCLDHGRYLRKFPGAANHLTLEMNGLYTVGCIFPEFKEAGDWRSFAADKLGAEESVQFLPDGAHYELSTGYHNVALDNIRDLALTAQLMGRMNELPAGYSSDLEKAFAFDLYLMTPDRLLPKFNDSWPVAVPDKMKQALAFFPDRPDFQWAASGGQQGSAPKLTSYFFPWAGFAVMRSDWGSDANYGVFRVGPIGAGHTQQDKLDFLIWAYGKEILFSSGGGSYEESKWRSYAIDTFSHNCILVDGKPQRRPTQDRSANAPRAQVEARWQTTADYDFASGVYDEGYGNENARIAIQTRRVLFVKPNIFVVVDTLTPHDNAEHTYQARWQLLPTQIHPNDDLKEVTTTAPGQPNLAVVPLNLQGIEVRTVSAQTEPELLGWNVRKDMIPKEVPATTVLHTWKGVGAHNFLTLFIPIPTGAPEPVKSVTAGNGLSATVMLTDGSKLEISADADPSGNLEVIKTPSNGGPVSHIKTF